MVKYWDKYTKVTDSTAIIFSQVTYMSTATYRRGEFIYKNEIMVGLF